MRTRLRVSSGSGAAATAPSSSSSPDIRAATHLATAIEHVPITAVKVYERNARAHTDRQITKLAGVIRQVGFLVPIIVDEANVIIAGHGRLAAAKALGMVTVPVIRAGHLSPHEVKAFRLA